MANLKDVSRLSGVNISTVSRYLSGKLVVKRTTEERIQKAVEQVGYRPNHIARALKLQTTDIIGVIVPNSKNPLFAEIVGGVYDVLSKNGYTYIQTASENNLVRELECFQLLQYKQVDGLIVIGCASTEDLFDQWLRDGIIKPPPTVFINRRYDKQDSSACVLNDFARGTYQATEYLLKTNRRRIAMVAGIPGIEESVIKERGYRQCLYDHGFVVNEDLIRPGYFQFEEGFRAAEYLLSMYKPDAVLAVNDLSAIAVLSCANRMGLRVPGDLAVIGYGNSEASQFTSPTLSTIDQQKYFCGQRGAHLLLDMLADKPANTEFIKTSLILRESC